MPLLIGDLETPGVSLDAGSKDVEASTSDRDRVGKLAGRRPGCLALTERSNSAPGLLAMTFRIGGTPSRHEVALVCPTLVGASGASGDAVLMEGEGATGPPGPRAHAHVVVRGVSVPPPLTAPLFEERDDLAIGVTAGERFSDR